MSTIIGLVSTFRLPLQYWLEYDDLMGKLPIRSCKMRLLIGIRC